MASKATRTTITKELDLELEQQNGDPAALTIKKFLVDGLEPDDELLAEYQLNVKVQKLDRRGRIMQGVAFKTDHLTGGDGDLWDDIIDDPELGPGRYNVYVEFRRPDDKADKVVVVKDINVGSQPQFGAFPNVQNSPERADPSENPLFTMLLNAMNTNQKTLTDLVTGLIQKANSGGDSSKAVVDALLQGIKIAQEAQDRTIGEEEEEEEEENPDNGWLEIAKPIITTLLAKIVAGDKAGVDAAADELKQLTPPETPTPGAS